MHPFVWTISQRVRILLTQKAQAGASQQGAQDYLFLRRQSYCAHLEVFRTLTMVILSQTLYTYHM